MKEMTLYRPLKIVKDVNTSIDKFRLPLHAVYGRIRPTLYVMITDFAQFKTVKDAYNIYVLYLNKGWDGFQPSKLTKNNFAYKHVVEFIKRYNLYNVKCVDVDLKGVLPQEKRPQQPDKRCYRQAMVDGRGCNISYEENHHETTYDKSGRVYHGVPVEYVDKVPKATQNGRFEEFEGWTDTAYAKRRDGMKVKQVKIRPEKRNASRKVTIINRYGLTTYIETSQHYTK